MINKSTKELQRCVNIIQEQKICKSRGLRAYGPNGLAKHNNLEDVKQLQADMT